MCGTIRWGQPPAVFDIFDTILGIVETTAGAIDALLGTSLAGTVAGFRGKMSGRVDDTFGENAIQIKRMAELDVYGTSQSWGRRGKIWEPGWIT